MALWPGGWTSRPLDGSGILVGRSQECDVRIDEASVSRRHVFIHVEPRLEVEDLGGSNGTVVRGRRLAPNQRVPLSPGDTVEIGNAMLIVQSAAAPASTRSPSPPSEKSEKKAGMVTAPMAAVTMPPPAETSPIDRLVELVAGSNLSVVILGETGVGKEVAAHRIHDLSARRAGPFVKINCAALTETLLESELFGHERGAFTGAVKAKVGLLEAANGGTVLLDEVGEMPSTTQVKLLRVLESREVMRVGSVEARRIDVRVLAATNRDLPALVAAGGFRSDLYFRLDGITIRLPPLRERRADIVPLATTLLAQAAKTATPPPFTPAALAKLESYSWPGNIRELRNVVERALVLSAGGPIDAAHLFVDTITLSTPPAPPPPRSSGDLRSDVEGYERARIEQALEKAGGNQTKAAELLGISRRTLVSRIEAYGMPRPRKK
jgi:two-component system, NtrC family, response regulator AtoC